MRAYYPNPPRLVPKWKLLSYGIDRYLGRRVNSSLGESDLASSDEVSAWLVDGYPETTARDLLGVDPLMTALLDIDRSSPGKFLNSDERSMLREPLRFTTECGCAPRGRKMNLRVAYQELGVALSELNSGIINDILNSHPAGYSTTGRDLIHDLLPF
jgi:hypothetical protein